LQTRNRIPYSARHRRRLGSGLALGLALALAPPGAIPASAQVTRIALPVRGMTCVLCTRGVKESMKQLDEVAEVSADLSSGEVVVEARPGKSLNIQRVRERVLSAGFKVGGECDVVAVGRFSLGPDRRLTFRVQGTPYVYQVLEGSGLLHLMRGHPDLKGAYSLTFRLHDHPNWKPPAISIADFEVLPPPAAAVGR
jgi:copper chaperone CopZ